MDDAVDTVEVAILTRLLEGSGLSPAALNERVTGSPGSVEQSVERLVGRGVIRRSVGGNLFVPRDQRPGVGRLLGIEPATPADVIEVVPEAPPRDRPEFFNDVFDHATYMYKLEDSISGARSAYENTVRKMRVGDLILGYLMDPYSEWVCILRVAKAPYRTSEELHVFKDLPWKVCGEFIAALNPGDGIPRLEAADEARALGGKAAPYRDSPKRVNPVAAGVIIRGILESQRHHGSAVEVTDPGPGFLEMFTGARA